MRYSKGANRADWFLCVSPGAYYVAGQARRLLPDAGSQSDNYQQFLKEWLGKNWVYHLRPLIASIKLAEFYPLDESRESVKAVWLTAITERERCCGRRHREAKVLIAR